MNSKQELLMWTGNFHKLARLQKFRYDTARQATRLFSGQKQNVRRAAPKEVLPSAKIASTFFCFLRVVFCSTCSFLLLYHFSSILE
jgi:hypothetical protein